MILLLAAAALAIDGRVVERDTNLGIAGVTLRAGDLSTTTDAKGRFQLDVAPGTEVAFEHPAYVALAFAAPDADEWRVRLWAEAETFEVVVEARRDEPVASVTRLDRERVLETPGTFEDPVRLAQSLAGVAVTPEYSPTAGDLALRGSAPGESRFLLDGIALPYLYHYSGYTSVLHTRLLDELALYPSTFNSEWGAAVGGIVDARTRWDRPEKTSASVNLNLVMAGAEVAVPLGERFTLRAGGRRSYLDAVQREDEQYTVFPRFWDYFARAEYAPGSGRAWGLLAFGAGDAWERYSGEPTELAGWEQESNPKLEYSQQYHAFALQHRELVGRTRLEGFVGAVIYDVEATLPEAAELRSEATLQFREEVVVAPRDGLAVAFGADGRQTFTVLDVETERAWIEVAREAPLLGRGASGGADVARFVGGGHAELRWDVGPVRLAPGVRVDGDTQTTAVTVDPRALVRWELGPDTRLRFAGGGYSQFQSVEALYFDTEGFGDPADVAPAHAWQGAAAVEHAIAGRWEVGAEVWGKQMTGLVLELPDGSARGDVEGAAWGVEATSRYRLRERFFASLSLGVGRATRGGEAFDYDQPWSANLIASWDFAPTWRAGLRLRGAAGLPYTPIVDGVLQAEDDTYQPVFGPRNSARQPVYTKVDARIEKTFYTRAVEVAAYAELWWVPGASNVMYQAYRYDYDDAASVAGPPFIPLVGVRGALR